MKKDRNAFFADYSFGNMNQGNMMNQNMGGWGNMPGTGHMPMPTDIDSRIAKLERQIGRLETRVSKLEGEYQPGMNIPSEYENYSNSMYMV